MSVASPPVSVEKFRNRIDASSRATVFEVVQGNDTLLDTLRFPDTDDMRSSRSRAFAFAASAAAASGQTRKGSKGESDRDIPSSAPGCPSGALVSCFEFIDPARFSEQVWPRVDVPLHTPRIGGRKTFDFGGVQRRHGASFVEPDEFVELLRQIGPGNNGSPTRFRIRSIKRLRSAPQSTGTIPLGRRGSGPALPLPEKPAAAPGAHVHASPSFAVADPSRSNGTKRCLAHPRGSSTRCRSIASVVRSSCRQSSSCPLPKKLATIRCGRCRARQDSS